MSPAASDNPPRFRFGDLPDDLVRTVFEVAANDCDKFAWSLAYVSKAVRSWVEPILYRQLPIDSQKTLLHLLSNVNTTAPLSSKPPGFYRSYVRRIYFGDRYNQGLKGITDLISACPNVTRLSAITMANPNLPVHEMDCLVGNHATWDLLRPTWLTISPCLFVPSRRHFRFAADSGSNYNPIFTHITHLELTWITRTHDVTWSWSSLPLLTALSHLCISSTPRNDALTCAARNLRAAMPWFPPTLTVCVFAFPRLTWPFVRTDAKQLILENGWRLDPRIVAAVPRAYYMHQLETIDSGGTWIKDEAICRWDGEYQRVTHEEDFWEQAVAMMQRKRDEKLQGNEKR
ncbi:hypothetical protein D9611_011166 [Ephemerocybe angulata]|uniref:Uncharacterized protein n=1 Tax=Ephemerocybe angulata TaxID=980116 RepID=A0A8H5FJY3_9AGAR|nr:hypothetical protein D9611_011166 [Tulosesus angulatus]